MISLRFWLEVARRSVIVTSSPLGDLLLMLEIFSLRLYWPLAITKIENIAIEICLYCSIEFLLVSLQFHVL